MRLHLGHRSSSFEPMLVAYILVLVLASTTDLAATAGKAEEDARPTASFSLVGEMEPLEGILAQPRRTREALVDHIGALPGLALLTDWVRASWTTILAVDLVDLSRSHIEQTRDFELPTVPGELSGRAIAHDEASGRWYLELRGPRLPARYDIVHRYLHVYASYDPASKQLGELTVTIRGWILE